MTAPRSGARTAKKLTSVERLRREKAIIADIKAGVLSYRQIAAKHAVSLPTVNNKARKAGISRGRRKGAKIIVRGPRPGRTAKKSTKKKTKTTRTAAAAPKKRVRRTRGTARRSTPARGGSFQAAFRALVLQHYPNISLRDFERLNDAVTREVA